MRLHHLLLLSAITLALSACGNGVHSSADLGQPLVTLKGRLDGVPPTGTATNNLQASMIWAALSPQLESCLETATTDSEIYACDDTSGFNATLATNSIDIEPVFPASFELPIYALPAPAILSGDTGALFGYGIIVVYEDGNHNSTLDLVGPEATDSADTVVGSSFADSTAMASIVVYREGTLSPLWKMFSLAPLNCPEPPQGFSVIEIAFTGVGAPCVIVSAQDATTTVTFESSESMRQLICEPQPETNGYPGTPVPSTASATCYGSGSLDFVVNPAAYCPNSQYYTLRGCYDSYDSSCGPDQWDWDLTNNPPSWWPCDGSTTNPGGPFFELIDAAGSLTSGQDSFFSVHYQPGTAPSSAPSDGYPLDQLKLWVTTGPSQVQSFGAPWFVTLIDNDSDGMLSIGDALEVAEPTGADVFNEADNYERTVELILDDGSRAVTNLATFTWDPTAN